MNEREIQICEDQARQVSLLLAKRREELSLSKKAVSERSGLSRSAVLRIENGERVPSLNTLLRHAKALDVKLWELIKSVEVD